MKANELRIGNWVNKRLKSGNGRVLSQKIGPQDIVRIYEGVGSFNYEPIPLTEEWLVGLGFVSLSDILEFGRGKYFIRKRYDKNFEMLQGLEYNSFTKAFKYVHQLQNLFFALTGEELELKIKD